MSNHLRVYNRTTISTLIKSRDGERRYWESLSFLETAGSSNNNHTNALEDAAMTGIKYVLVGVCEDIGPRANCGRGGATLGWNAFLRRFVNLPCNNYLDVKNVLLLGEIDCDDIQQASSEMSNQDDQHLEGLRNLCAELDSRVTNVLRMVFAAGLEPIVIGGGHNNCFGIMQALKSVTGKACHAINFDPHADFRILEGRHSGNGFRYAYHNNLLCDYHVVGLHAQKNNQSILDALHDAQFSYVTYQDILIKRNITLRDAVQIGLRRFQAQIAARSDGSSAADDSIPIHVAPIPLGIEVDVDSISGVPVSAYTNCGFSVNDAEHFVYLAAQHPSAAYLHICEAAPGNHPQGFDQGTSEVGQVLSGLVCSFLTSRNTR